MTRPNFYDPGDVVAGCRRVFRGEFRLQPTPEAAQIVLYLTFHWAKIFHIDLTAAVQMSNHYHYNFIDRFGLGSAFQAQLHAWITLALNVLQKRRGFMWFPGQQPYQARCLTARDELDQLLYTALNPARAGIIKRSSLWPGTHFTPEHCGLTLEVARPAALAAWTNFPETVKYTIAKPKCYAHMSDEEVRTDFRRRRLRQEDLISAKRRGKYIGIKAALSLPITYCTDDPPATPHRHFVSSCSETLEAKLRQDGLRLAEYRRARKRFLAGRRNVVWPPGTYAMHVWHGCPRRGPRAGP